jgi:hypothetical protein
MKWFVILAVILGGYYVMLMAGTSFVLGETQRMQEQYMSLAEESQQLADSSYAVNR